MEFTEQQKGLKKVLDDYGKPDPSLVQKLPKKRKNFDGSFTTIELDFVSHADITRILLTIDPTWEWTPLAVENGRPAIHVENGMATMWGYLTVLGHSRLGVGSVSADKGDYEKELIGDFLRNAAMRFGIALSLWSKSSAGWDDEDAAPVASRPAAPRPAPKPAGKPVDDREEREAREAREALDALADAFGGELIEEPVQSAPRQAQSAPKTGGAKASEKQIGLIKKLVKQNNIQNHLQKIGTIVGRPVNDLTDLSVGEASSTISELLKMDEEPF